MMTPTLHSNGTSSHALSESNKAVRDALRLLQSAMHDDAPNARDYYVQGPDAYRQAEREYLVRLAVVSNLQREYQLIAESLADQDEQLPKGMRR